MSEPQTFAELLQQHGPLGLIQQWRQHRARHWNGLVRIVLSVRPDDVEPSGALRWSTVTARDVDVPVTREALGAWLATRPPHAAVLLLTSLLDPRDPREPSWRDAIDLAREVYPEAVADLVPSAQTDPWDARRARHAGVALAVALADRKARHADSGVDGMLKFADDATRARFLALAGDKVIVHEFRELGRQLEHTEDLTVELMQGYDRALAAIVSSLPKREANWLFAYTRLASTEGLVAALRGPSKNIAAQERLIGLIAAQGFAHGALALADVLDHKKLGARAAMALALMGARGVTAVEYRVAQGPLASAAARRYAAALTSLPKPDASLWDGEWYGFTRFGRAPADDLRDDAAWPATPTHSPTPVEALEAAVKEKPARDLLPATGWADLLQIATIDPWFSDLRAAHATALRLGRLGHGDDPRALAAAVDELSWSGHITTHYPQSDWGYGWALLWAGADESVYRHAIARHTELGANHWIGYLDRHFARPVRSERPAWLPSIEALLWFLNANIASTVWQGPPRLVASLATPAAKASLTPDDANLWVHATVEGATQVTLRLRGECVLTVDVAARTWTVTLPKGASGASGVTPPLDAHRPLRLAVETARDGMYVGIGGAMVHGPFTKVPAVVAPVELSAEGDGARITSFTVHAKATVREAEAAGALLMNPDAPQGYAEVAGQKSPAAAHALALVARLGVEPWSKLAADALATMKGDALTPWRDAAPFVFGDEAPPEPVKATKKKAAKVEAPAPETPVVELPMTFTVRSFEDVVRTFEAMALTGKTRSKKHLSLHRGQTDSNRHEYASFNPKGATEDWGARTGVPWPAVYLGKEKPDVTKFAYFAEQLCDLPALCRKGRGTWARGEYVVERDHFVVTSLQGFPPDDGYDDGEFMFTVNAAAWKVSEGWAWALTATAVDDLARLVGVRALPPQVEWTKVDRVTLGNW